MLKLKIASLLLLITGVAWCVPTNTVMAQTNANYISSDIPTPAPDVAPAPSANSNLASIPNVSINDAYKSIVKIKTFVLNEDFAMQYEAFGSGILIDKAGLVLTNNHTIEQTNSYDGTDKDAVYQICLPQNTTDEPDCSYMAKLVAKNADLDVALLQIVGLPGITGLTEFPFLEMNQSDNVIINDTVTAIGYPDIGGSTVTLTKGIVSGKTDKYGKLWIKTDAVISFGSSGGAALDANGKIIGITSAGSADMSGSLGYVINIVSLNQWISEHKGVALKPAPLADRLAAFVQKERSMNDTGVFQSQSPKFSITKPKDWAYDYRAENILSISRPDDEDGGLIIIQTDAYPFTVGVKDAVTDIKFSYLFAGRFSFLKIQQNKDIKISGVPAKKLMIMDEKMLYNMILIPVKNTFVYITYFYGTDDKDKAVVDSIINSMVVKTDGPNFTESKVYVNKKPNFKFNLGQNWAALPKNDPSSPLVLMNKKYRDLWVKVAVLKSNDKFNNLNNEEVVKVYRDQMDQRNTATKLIDFKVEYLSSKPHYNLSKNLRDVIKVSHSIKTLNNKVFAYKTIYSKRYGQDYWLDITVLSLNTNKKMQNIYQKEVERMLQGYSLK